MILIVAPPFRACPERSEGAASSWQDEMPGQGPVLPHLQDGSILMKRDSGLKPGATRAEIDGVTNLG